MPQLDSELYDMLVKHKQESNIAALLVQRRFRDYTEVGDYFKIADDGRLSYLPSSRASVLSFLQDGFGVKKGRMLGKPGKMIRKALPPSVHQVLKDEDYEVFTNLVKAWQAARGQIEFAWYRGADIPRLYNYRYHDGGHNLGSLGHSCMQNVPIEYLELYEACSSVELLVMRLGDATEHHVGRALVWTMGDTKIMDRIYGSDATIRAFKNYAGENGILYRSSGGFDGGDIFSTADGTEGQEAITVQVDRLPNFFPYMDTMRSLNVRDLTLTNAEHHDEEGWITLGSTGGGWYGRVVLRCSGCDTRLREVRENYDLPAGRSLRSMIEREERCYGCVETARRNEMAAREAMLAS